MSTVAETAARTQTRARARARRRRSRHLINRILFYLLLAVIIVYIAFPFYWAIRSAFTPDSELFKTPVQYWPSNPTWSNFSAVLGCEIHATE